MKREYGPSFKSSYAGPCLDCKREIRPGQAITGVNHQGYVHTRHTPAGRVATVGLALVVIAVLICCLGVALG